MKTVAVLLLAMASLVSGCIAYDVPYEGGGGYGRDRGHDRDRDRDRDHSRDRDRDGVPDNRDRRPGDPNRY